MIQDLKWVGLVFERYPAQADYRKLIACSMGYLNFARMLGREEAREEYL